MFEPVDRKSFELRCSVVCPEYVDLFLQGEFFFADGDTLVALNRDEVLKLVWLTGLCGRGLEFFRNLVHISRRQGYNYVGFTMKTSNPLHNALVRYLGLKPHFVGPEGNDYLLDLRHGGNRRI